MKERRTSKFTERLSLFMVRVAAIGAAYVLLAPKFTFLISGQVIEIGSGGFSADLKGAVVSLILIGGWSAVKEFWLGTSASSEKKSDALQRMVENPSQDLKTDKIDIEATGSVNIEKGVTK